MAGPKGRLELTWMGKDQSLIQATQGQYDYQWVDASDPRVCEVRAINERERVGAKGVGGYDENLLIVGDSADVLRTLVTVPEWRGRYRGKVRLIYIDPPFNTGQTFDHYADQLEHSVWLTFMRDRLTLMADLLTPDGSIWVHLDDCEVHRMRCLMDEVFGPDRFVAQVAWRSTDSSSNNAKSFAKDHNVILVYGREAQWRPRHLPDPDKQSHYKNPNGDPRGPWYDGRDVQNPKHRENLRYPITAPNGNVIEPPKNGWRWEWATMQQKMDSGEVFFNADGTAIKRITYLYEQQGLPPSDLWASVERTGSSRGAKNHLKKLFPGVPTPSLFDTPKPELLLQRIIELSTNVGDIVLDCFAGSGATAATAHKMGRRWVTTELLESNVTRFTQPRLTKVVNGEDPDGISTTKARVGKSPLPGEITPTDAAAFSKTLKVVAEAVTAEVDLCATLARIARQDAKADVPTLTPEERKTLLRLLKTISGESTTVDLTRDVTKAMLDATATHEEVTVNWAGGGGFTVAGVGPSMYEVADDGVVYLSEGATNGQWSQAVAGQLGFRRTPTDPLFCGQKGRTRLAVIDGVVDRQVVKALVFGLAERENVVIVGKAVLPEADELLRALRPASRIRKAPNDLFPRKTVK